MPDRKQVIWDIERCICHIPDACRDCSKFGAYGTKWECMESLLSDAIALLKRDEIQLKCKDEIIKAADKMLKNPVYCPNCGALVEVGK